MSIQLRQTVRMPGRAASSKWDSWIREERSMEQGSPPAAWKGASERPLSRFLTRFADSTGRLAGMITRHALCVSPSSIYDEDDDTASSL